MLRDIVLNFLLAGRDTTACALSWTLYELLRHPAVRDRVRAEADRVFGPVDAAHEREQEEEEDDGDGGDGGDAGLSAGRYTYERAAKGLAYTHAVVTEVLRLHPSVPIDIKWAVGADVLPDGTPIAPNSVLCYTPYSLGRSAALPVKISQDTAAVMTGLH